MIGNRDENALKCAVLLYNGMKQDDIADKLDLKGQAEVSKLLKYARDQGWLTWSLHWPAEMSDEQIKRLQEETGYKRLQELREKIFEWNVENTLSGFDPKTVVHVIQARESEKDGSGETEHLSAFGRRAADVIVPLINRDDVGTCAIAWGRTVESVVDAIPVQTSSGHAKEFLPICGEPLNFPNFGVSPSSAAATLARAFRVQSEPKSLQGVPARVPRDIPNGIRILKQFAARSRAYSYIFGTKDSAEPGRIAQVDMVLTGVGNVDSSESDPWYQETKECEGGIDHLREISCGNIGGLWLPKLESSPSDREELDAINSRWLGISLEHLKAAARRAIRSPHPPGVVVVSALREKRDIVRAALPIVNQLIISSELADALVDE
jgi:DNA-binding transcriptional regulator LsrR (DeoR family)